MDTPFPEYKLRNKLNQIHESRLGPPNDCAPDAKFTDIADFAETIKDYLDARQNEDGLAADLKHFAALKGEILASGRREALKRFTEIDSKFHGTEGLLESARAHALEAEMILIRKTFGAWAWLRARAYAIHEEIVRQRRDAVYGCSAYQSATLTGSEKGEIVRALSENYEYRELLDFDRMVYRWKAEPPNGVFLWDKYLTALEKDPSKLGTLTPPEPLKFDEE